MLVESRVDPNRRSQRFLVVHNRWRGTDGRLQLRAGHALVWRLLASVARWLLATTASRAQPFFGFGKCTCDAISISDAASTIVRGSWWRQHRHHVVIWSCNSYRRSAFFFVHHYLDHSRTECRVHLRALRIRQRSRRRWWRSG